MTDDPHEVAGRYDDLELDVGDRVDHVATVTIDRPARRNALNSEIRAGLKALFPALEADDAVRVVVLTGSEETSSFVAGADVTELRERDSRAQREAGRRPRIYETVADHPKPVIARINGHALGGGCELIQACDIRIAREGSRLGQPEIALGIMPGGGATQRLPRLVGKGHAMRLILTGEVIDTEEAADIGLVEAVRNEATFDEHVYDLAASIATKSPLAVRRAKRAVAASDEMSLSAGIEYEFESFVQLFDSRDKNEGIDAFLEDRDAEWEGR